MNCFIIFLFSLLLLPYGCSSRSDNNSAKDDFSQAVASNYFKTVNNVTIEVYYEPGAEPFDGNRSNGAPLWSILGNNLSAIFQYRSSPPSLTYPNSVTQMTALDDSGKSEWTVDEVYQLYQANHIESSTEKKAVFYLYFLNGQSDQGSNIIGFSITGTPIIAIFKDVVRASGAEVTQKFVEQSTIIHEMGHALGFVNNGVPLSVTHQDVNNGSHTTNRDCIMYWLNEGRSSLASFVQNYIISGSDIMWGSEVLSDAEQFSE